MADLYAPYEDPALKTAQSGYETAVDAASQYQTAASMLPAALKDAINTKLDYNKDLIAEKNKSMVDYFNAPSQARLDYQDIFNPFQREALVEKSVNNAYLPYKTNQDVLAARLGSIEDIINKASGAFGGQVTAAQGAATLAKSKLDWLFGLAGAKSDAAYKMAQLAKGEGGSGGLGGLGDLFTIDENGNLVLKSAGANNTGVPTEPQPTSPPPTDSKYANVNWRSPEGQWEWNKSYQAWVPSGTEVTN